MKRKRASVHDQPWTEWIQLAPPDPALYIGDQEPPAVDYRNSRYHVALWFDGADDHPMGKWIHLSIKDHDRTARHDWRDLQRIKNELVGPEYEAIEIYPAESRLVDTANQYHLYVFMTWRPPQGFYSRLLADGKSQFGPNAVQRPFEVRPPDCLNGPDLDRYVAMLADRPHTAMTPQQLLEARQRVANGAGHECDEWWSRLGTCLLCDRAKPVARCPAYRPDANGECLTCDEPYDAHEPQVAP